MDNFNKKRKMYNEYILGALKDRYGFSFDYMRKSLRGDRTSIMSCKIKEDYKTLLLQMNSIIETYKNQ